MRNAKTLRPVSTPVLTLLALLLVGATNIKAAPGDLDPTFGNGGIVIGGSGSTYTLANAQGMALQADGKIVVVGDSYDFRVARYNPNGSLDTSFGGGGVVVTPGIGSAYSVAIQADGKIVVAGGGFAVVRYNPNGSLDTTFNGTGIVSTQINNGSSHARSVAIQSDGKIVVAGDNSTGPFTLAFALVRYNTNGSLDTSFDNDGIVTTQVGSGFAVSGAEAVAIQADGKIVAAGYYNGLVRYNADGSLDTTFNGTGIVTRGALLVAIQADGKILTAGGNGLLRYNANGTRDTSFGGTGGVATGIGVGSVAIQADGKIVVAGGTGGAFAVTRLHGNGSPDTSFGGTGTVITPLDTQGYYYGAAGAVAIQPDGKIVAAGVAIEPVFDSLAVALVRYQGDSATPTSCPNPIDCPDFFVRQQYRDFLNREPDAPGLAHWAGEITECSDPVVRFPGESFELCTERKRANTSAAFFLSPEFQNTGSFVLRVYWGTLGKLLNAQCPGVPNGLAGNCRPRYSEYINDMATITQEIVINDHLDPARINANKRAFVESFVTRAEFRAIYDGLNNTQYVDKLFETTGISPSSTDRQELINGLTNGTETRASVVYKIVDGTNTITDGQLVFNTPYGQAFYNQEFDTVFVMMEYFGYLRRNPDQEGYDFWLAKMRRYGNWVDAQMVLAFIKSPEYRSRF